MSESKILFLCIFFPSCQASVEPRSVCVYMDFRSPGSEVTAAYRVDSETCLYILTLGTL